MATEENLSHAEIWDDSVLVNSWNAALEEYKKYHSIEARGEDVEEVLTRHENKDCEGSSVTPLSDHKDNTKSLSSDEMRLDAVETSHPKKSPALLPDISQDRTKAQASAGSSTFQEQNPILEPNSLPQGAEPQQPALPIHLIGQVHDEGLKNLLMSWYYAGYYTGFYEGQQQGREAKSR